MDLSDDPDIVTLKGITTVYDGLFPVITVSRTGVPRPLKKRQPKWARVKRVHYLEGKTLNRVCVYEGLGTRVLQAAVRVINDRQRDVQCDDCIRLHRPTNKNCSATLGIDTAATEEGVLYDFITKKPAGRWQRTALQIGGRERVGTAQFTKA